MTQEPSLRIGMPDKPLAPLIEAREKVYGQVFPYDENEEWTVNHQIQPVVPHIDVYLFRSMAEDADGNEFEFSTLVTGGMSDYPMRVPDDVPFRRAELVMYVEKPSEIHITLLRWLAELPHVQEDIWYGFGTTMTNGQPPQPIFEGSQLDSYLFLNSRFANQMNLHEQLIIEGDPTTLLWVIPITNLERKYVMQRGINAFLDVLDRHGHDMILDEGRRSYIRAAKR